MVCPTNRRTTRPSCRSTSASVLRASQAIARRPSGVRASGIPIAANGRRRGAVPPVRSNTRRFPSLTTAAFPRTARLAQPLIRPRNGPTSPVSGLQTTRLPSALVATTPRPSGANPAWWSPGLKPAPVPSRRPVVTSHTHARQVSFWPLTDFPPVTSSREPSGDQTTL